MQRTANTDAYLLMQFGRDIEPIKALLPPKGTAPSKEVQEHIRTVGQSTVRGLQANGHSLADAIALMRAVLYL